MSGKNSNQPAPSAVTNFLQIALWTVTIYLGYQLLTGGFNKDNDNKKSDDVYQSLKTSAIKTEDDNVQLNLDNYISLLNKEEQGNVITTEKKQQRLMDGIVTAAYAKYQVALKQKDVNKMQEAHQILFNYEYEYAKNPCWKHPNKIEDEKGFVIATYSAYDLYHTITDQLAAWNKEDLVWGFIPGWQLIDFLVSITGKVSWFSYALAGLFLAICVRAAIWPISQRQLMFGRQMSQLSPLLAELKEKYEGQELQLKTMQLYKDYGINPASGCLIGLAQLPLFFAIYQCMLRYKIEFMNGTFLWVNPEFADTINSYFPSFTSGIVASNLGSKDYLLILIHGALTTMAMLLSPVQDPNNASQQRMIGVMSGVMMTFMMMMWPIPSAFVLYWIFTSVLSTAQTLRAHRLPAPPLIKKGADGKDVLLTDIQKSSMFKNTGAPKKNKPKKKK